ncbi:capsule biosynthesis GfcC family protein [Vibrio sp. SCSIO 43140]|uniref:capsule biosynthesis GfcC family protein n=1 Tax=Vibrio sp. SCSIO 43140 TaxID=2819100 RepID=UPI0020757C49|nr:capsule biosynthesis GfcC family protein [Vibrio sp. SCSIO 43140]USD60293.1 capsule biosynthesis GfcC family protein [Vibrio sp. SCSIO 43140]
MIHGWLKRRCSALLLACPFFAVSAELSVLLPEQSVRLEYSQPTRLETVLRDTHSQALKNRTSLDSVQAQLFSLSKQSIIENQVDELVKKLESLQQQEPEIGANYLLEQIQQFSFKYREFTSLDYDVVQSQHEGNPLLTGNYELNIGPRNNQVIFMGAINKIEETPHRAQWFLADYFKSMGHIRLKSASESIAWVIQPDGNIQQTDYGLWNFKPHFIAPGAIVYVPTKSLPSEFESLNKDYVELLRHKVKNNE